MGMVVGINSRLERDGTCAGDYAVAREKSHDDAERRREKGWRSVASMSD